jgi:hypothetical protein
MPEDVNVSINDSRMPMQPNKINMYRMNAEEDFEDIE